MKRKKIIKSYFKEMLLFLKIMELNFSKIKKSLSVYPKTLCHMVFF